MPPAHGSDPYDMNQFTIQPKPQSYGGDHRSAVMGADMTVHQDFTQHSGRRAPSYSEDTGAALQPHMNQNFDNYMQQHQQQFNRQPAAASQPYNQHTSPSYISPGQYPSPGVMQRRPAAGESFPTSGDINTIEAMKKSGGLVSTGRRSEELVLQTSVAQEYTIPTYTSGSPNQVVFPNNSPANSKLLASSSDDFNRFSANYGQKPVQSTLDATPYSDTARLVGAKPDQDFNWGSSGDIASPESRENDVALQKQGINLQRLGGIEDTTAQDRVRTLEERLRKTEGERDEAKRGMERSNAMLNNRIRRLEEQLGNITGAGNEVSLYMSYFKVSVYIQYHLCM